MFKSQKGSGAVYLILGLLILLLFGAGWYFWAGKNFFKGFFVPLSSYPPSQSNSLSPSPSASTSPTPSPSATPSPSPSPTIKPELFENIKASVISKNTAALEGYMSDTVNVIIEATECCGNITKSKAIAQMDYLNDAQEPWNFNDNNPVAIALRKKNPGTFPEGSIIGTSANKMLVTFTLNQAKTKIEKLYMAIDYKLQGI